MCLHTFIGQVQLAEVCAAMSAMHESMQCLGGGGHTLASDALQHAVRERMHVWLNFVNFFFRRMHQERSDALLPCG